MPLTFLLATLADRVAIPDTLRNTTDPPQRLADMMGKLFQKFYRRINDNHGVKEANVLSLFGPLGVPAAALGTTLLPDLDSFGGLRGTHAHLSVRAVQSPLDPESEYQRVERLIGSLTVFDQWLVTYRRRIR